MWIRVGLEEASQRGARVTGPGCNCTVTESQEPTEEVQDPRLQMGMVYEQVLCALFLTCRDGP